MFLIASCILIFLDVPQGNGMTNDTMIYDAEMPPSDQHENTSDLDENIGSEVMDGIRLSESKITFQQVTSIEDFSIVVNDLVLDSEFPKHLRTKYYELCCSQGMFLHEHLLEGQNCKLVVGMICETINIADAIKACKLTISSDCFEVWYKSLKGLEMFGMNVRFLIARLKKLMCVSSKSKRYTEIRTKRDEAKKEEEVLKVKLNEVRKTICSLDNELDSQNLNAKNLDVEFQVLANAPW